MQITLRSPFARSPEDSPKEKTAYEKMGENVSTNRAFENRVDPATYAWLIVHDTRMKVEKRASMAMLAVNIFVEPYAMSINHGDIWEKLTAWEIRCALWSRHYRSMMRKNPDDRESIIGFFETKMIPAFGVVWHSCFHPEQVISQTTLVNIPPPVNGYGAELARIGAPAKTQPGSGPIG